jgi:hypothetical protein
MGSKTPHQTGETSTVDLQDGGAQKLPPQTTADQLKTLVKTTPQPVLPARK